MAYLRNLSVVLVTLLSKFSQSSLTLLKTFSLFCARLATVGVSLSVISNMASAKDATAAFFLHGNTRQYDYVLKLYPRVLALKAEEKKKPEELIKLDEW
jgi:hypothetical protein